TATITTTNTGLLGGTRTLSAIYAGDGNYATSTSANFSQIVNRHTTSSTITQASIAPSQFGDAVVFTVQITPLQGTLLPTGTVTLYEGSTVIGSTTSFSNVGGIATALVTPTSLAALTVGPHTLFAVYSGDGNYIDSTTPDFGQTVDKRTPTTTISQIN